MMKISREQLKGGGEKIVTHLELLFEDTTTDIGKVSLSLSICILTTQPCTCLTTVINSVHVSGFSFLS